MLNPDRSYVVIVVVVVTDIVKRQKEPFRFWYASWPRLHFLSSHYCVLFFFHLSLLLFFYLFLHCQVWHSLQVEISMDEMSGENSLPHLSLRNKVQQSPATGSHEKSQYYKCTTQYYSFGTGAEVDFLGWDYKNYMYVVHTFEIWEFS